MLLTWICIVKNIVPPKIASSEIGRMVLQGKRAPGAANSSSGSSLLRGSQVQRRSAIAKTMLTPYAAKAPRQPKLPRAPPSSARKIDDSEATAVWLASHFSRSRPWK